jgi:hypothetical protein
MKQLFDDVSFKCSKLVTKKTIVLHFHWRYICFPSIRMLYTVFTVLFALLMKLWIPFIFKKELINDFENIKSFEAGISLNLILNSFQCTVKEYNITDDLIQAFLKNEA